MGSWIDWLVKRGHLTPEEAGGYDGRDLGSERIREDDAVGRIMRSQRREGTESRPGRQTSLFDKSFPSLTGKSETKYVPVHKWTSAGGVVVKALTPELIEYVYLVKPAGNAYGRLVFPKGRVDFDKGETKELAAIREVAEEAGVLARPVPDGYLGEFEGSMSNTHYYLMFRVKDSTLGHDNEMEQVYCVPLDIAQQMLEQVHNYRDLKVLAEARVKIAAIKANLLNAPPK